MRTRRTEEEMVLHRLGEPERQRAKQIKQAIKALAKAEYEGAGGFGHADHPDHIAARIAREHALVKQRFVEAGKPVPSWVLA